jgi:lipase
VLPVVVIHGLVGPFADVRNLRLLGSVVAAPDLLGYGREAKVDPDGITIESQATHLYDSIGHLGSGARVHLVGHSVGAVVAALFAHRWPERVASFVNVEGNFTREDAFWSARVAAQAPAEVAEQLAADRAHPARWLREGGIEVTDDRVRLAAQALAYQPSTTIQAMAAAVVAFTGRPDYEPLLRQVFDHTPVHLVAGARSRSGWNVPEWALSAAASYAEISGAGHMVMLEAPGTFIATLADVVSIRARDSSP